MIEILFRGQMKTDNGCYKKGDWVQGDFVTLIDGKEQHPHIYGKGEVKAETVGQYTGLTDKNGTKIFEGDILNIDGEYLPHWIKRGEVAVVEYKNGGFDPLCEYDSDCGTAVVATDCEVIGNIHDNPELLKARLIPNDI